MEQFTWKGDTGESVIVNADCLEVIKKIPDKSIKAIITDPPYFLGMTHNGQRGSFTDLNIASPFYRQLFEEMGRVLKKDGCIYFFCDWRGYAYYYTIMDEVLGAQNLLVWDKGNGCGNYYTFEHEFVMFHTNNKQFRKKGCRNIIRGISGFSNLNTKKEDGEKVHPTQKPVELITKLMLDSTEEGDTVLDCFSGSGTTGVSCIRNHRNFIGMEIQKKYFAISKDRVTAELEDLNLKKVGT